MAAEIFCFFADDLFKPFLDTGVIDIVVVDPVLVAGVVRRVDVNALHLAVVIGQECLERFQVVAMNDEIVMQARLRREAFGLHRFEFMEGDEQVEILHQRFALEFE